MVPFGSAPAYCQFEISCFCKYITIERKKIFTKHKATSIGKMKEGRDALWCSCSCRQSLSVLKYLNNFEKKFILCKWRANTERERRRTAFGTSSPNHQSTWRTWDSAHWHGIFSSVSWGKVSPKVSPWRGHKRAFPRSRSSKLWWPRRVACGLPEGRRGRMRSRWCRQCQRPGPGAETIADFSWRILLATALKINWILKNCQFATHSAIQVAKYMSFISSGFAWGLSRLNIAMIRRPLQGLIQLLFKLRWRTERFIVHLRKLKVVAPAHFDVRFELGLEFGKLDSAALNQLRSSVGLGLDIFFVVLNRQVSAQGGKKCGDVYCMKSNMDFYRLFSTKKWKNLYLTLATRHGGKLRLTDSGISGQGWRLDKSLKLFSVERLWQIWSKRTIRFWYDERFLHRRKSSLECIQIPHLVPLLALTLVTNRSKVVLRKKSKIKLVSYTERNYNNDRCRTLQGRRFQSVKFQCVYVGWRI